MIIKEIKELSKLSENQLYDYYEAILKAHVNIQFTLDVLLENNDTEASVRQFKDIKNRNTKLELKVLKFKPEIKIRHTFAIPVLDAIVLKSML